MPDRDLEAFVVAASHDLRSQVRSILGWTSVLEEECGGRLTEEGNRSLARIRRGARQLSSMLDALLALSRANRSELRSAPLDLAVLAREIAEGLRRADHTRRVEVVVPDSLPVRGDEALLRIALENLIGNAWKYTSRSERPRIEVGVEVREGEEAYFVRDDGVGFPPEQAELVFKPFARFHDPLLFPGSGIGLATVRRIVERHGGRIWAESEVGGGATFYFTLAAGTA